MNVVYLSRLRSHRTALVKHNFTDGVQCDSVLSTPCRNDKDRWR